MASTYVPERQIEYWTSRQIEDFLLNAGHQVSVCPIEQIFEKLLPADFVFGVDNSIKLFGIQYKVLYHNGSDYWRLNKVQHQTLANFSWIYYGLSDMKQSSSCRNSLYYLRVYKSTELPMGNFYANNFSVKYHRWAMFYKELIKCNFGITVKTRGELIDVLTTYITQADDLKKINNIVDIFIFDIQSKTTIKLSSQLKPNSEYDEI